MQFKKKHQQHHHHLQHQQHHPQHQHLHPQLHLTSQVQQLVTQEQLPNPDDMMEVTPAKSDSMEITPTTGIYDSAAMKNILLACKWVEENNTNLLGRLNCQRS
ncbi:protein FAM76B-like [Clarias gariepinus]|uniref:protein FAM76B-like n=1 Tax=Clarias gariepinus TaxID=13013 RepID=UPI00234CB0BB|nr:protein FAM76B-like [Clarias gariepinus]